MFLAMLVYLKARATVRGGGVQETTCEPGTILPISFGCCISSTYLALQGVRDLRQVSNLILTSSLLICLCPRALISYFYLLSFPSKRSLIQSKSSEQSFATFFMQQHTEKMIKSVWHTGFKGQGLLATVGYCSGGFWLWQAYASAFRVEGVVT